MCNPTRKPTDGTVPIRFGTYNTHNGQRGGLEAALRGMSQANMDLGILQETKLTDGVYTRGSAGYKVIATVRRADTAAASHFSTASHPTSWWRRWRGAGLM